MRVLHAKRPPPLDPSLLRAICRSPRRDASQFALHAMIARNKRRLSHRHRRRGANQPLIGLVFTFLTVRFRTLGPSDPTWVRRLISSFKRSSIFVDGNVETVAGGRQVFGAVTRAATDITALTQRTLETMG